MFDSARDDELGPDLAFLPLPAAVVANLAAAHSFLPLDKQATLREQPAPKAALQGELLCGVIAEETEAPTAQNPKTMFSGRIMTGRAVELQSTGGFDRWEFQPEAFDDGSKVNSFGGVSGGGLWRVWLKKRENGQTFLAERRLIGVAYYQTTRVGEVPRKIIAHGSKSIFDNLVPKIRSRGLG